MWLQGLGSRPAVEFNPIHTNFCTSGSQLELSAGMVYPSLFPVLSSLCSSLLGFTLHCLLNPLFLWLSFYSVHYLFWDIVERNPMLAPYRILPMFSYISHMGALGKQKCKMAMVLLLWCSYGRQTSRLIPTPLKVQWYKGQGEHKT